MSALRRAQEPRSESKRPRLADNWRRLNGPRRVAGLDLARGLAVIGMFAAHLLWIDPFDSTDVSTWTDVANGRSSILFATIAGVSIALITGGRIPVSGAARERASARLALRALCIWVIGVLLILTQVPVYVILPAYAILFLLALPLLRARPAFLFALAAVLGLVMPWMQALIVQLPFWDSQIGAEIGLLLGLNYPFTVWIAFIVAGLGVGRLDLRSLGTQAALVFVGAGLAILAYTLAVAFPAVPDTYLALVWTADAHSDGLLEVFGSGGFALAVLGLCLLLTRPWREGAWLSPIGWLALPLRAVGSMPLTAYVGQIIAWWVLQPAPEPGESTLEAFRETDPFVPFVVWTIVLCTLWALLVGRGPLEWALDRVSRLAGRRGRGAGQAVDRVEP
ncbi:heparan-alpha-glucosaminide N-acetyltransferase domain-containing protein [Microbacterium sp.]|uniref:heparan-alpha-glucosaminide N-acetyltransferase domain-containing protein n=1 Tax=Microbacterium sp. TaxID=51671 RepID=UPI0037CBA65B